jgi:hypothetical protein
MNSRPKENKNGGFGEGENFEGGHQGFLGNIDVEGQVDKDEFMSQMMKKIRMFLALKYCKTDNIPSELLPGLFIGSIGAAMCKTKLQDLGITHILCVADSINPIFPKDFTYKVVKILDSPEVRITDHLQDCFDFISSGILNGKVLVHW